MKLRNLIGSLLFCVLLCCLVRSQSIGVSGDILGTARDSSGALLPQVTITAAEVQTGLRRSTVTNAYGEYRLTGLLPGAYDVTAEHAGFATEVHKAVALAVGQSLLRDFQLKVSSTAEQIEVTDLAAVVDVERSSQANEITDRYISNLPIDRRDYLTFALLAPGVSNSNVLAANTDFRVKQTPQSGLSFYGSNGRGNSISVDGGETNDDAGGVRLNVSQDTVREFEINRSNYSAELGSASGASINIVTKGGTDHLRGSVYGFFRNDAMDARDPFAFSPALAPDSTFSNFSLKARGKPIKDTLDRQQFGGTIGFPLKKDKTFLFSSYEGLRSDAQHSVPLLTHSSIFGPTDAQDAILAGLANEAGHPVVPCLNPPGQKTVSLPSDICAFALQSFLTIDPTQVGNPFLSSNHLANYRFIVGQFEKDGGVFPFPIRQHTGTVKLDHRFNNTNQGSLRYTFAHLTESDPDVQALIGFSRGTSVLNWDSTLQGSWLHQFSASSLNELRLQWNWYQFNVDTNDRGGPGLDVQGYGFFGRGIFLPSHTSARRYELTDNVTLLRGHHTIRLGAFELIRGNNTVSDTFFAGRFEFLDLPGFALSNCLQFPSAPIAAGGCGLPSSVNSASINTLQAWGLGAPGFYEQGFGDPRYVQTRPFTAAYLQDSWQIRSGLNVNYGLRYELDSQDGPLSTYKKNFAPRLSFAWDVLNRHTTVVRGGYGVFYSPIYAHIPNVVKTLGNVNGVRQIANTLVSILGAPPANSAEIYGALAPKILCGQPPAGQNACISQEDLSPFVTVSNSGPLPQGTVLFFAQPGYRNPQSQQASLGIEREVGHGMSISANYIYVHTTHLPWAIDKNLLPGAPVVSGAVGANGLPTNGLAFQDWGAPQCFINPSQCFADPTRTILQNNEYASVANAVYHGGILEFKKRFSDRFSMIASYTFSKAIEDSTDFNSDYAAFNEVDLAAERSVSDFDQRHKVVLAAVAQSPWHSKLLSGFEVAPIITYNSGHPFNLLAGADINGDNHFTNDRPPGAPRNSGMGPDYACFDVRLARKFRLNERTALGFTIEGFNIANRTNYASVNNTVGASFGPPFNVRGTSNFSPSQPLGFTAALPRREIQLGVRFDF